MLFTEAQTAFSRCRNPVVGKPIAPNTYLKKQDDLTYYVELHGNRIVTITMSPGNPERTRYIVTAQQWPTITTHQRLQKLIAPKKAHFYSVDGLTRFWCSNVKPYRNRPNANPPVLRNGMIFDSLADGDVVCVNPENSWMHSEFVNRAKSKEVLASLKKFEQLGHALTKLETITQGDIGTHLESNRFIDPLGVALEAANDPSAETVTKALSLTMHRYSAHAYNSAPEQPLSQQTYLFGRAKQKVRSVLYRHHGVYEKRRVTFEDWFTNAA